MMIGENPADSGEKQNLEPECLGKLGLLVAGIAHNLYGPLTGILGTMDLLKLKHPGLSEDFERITHLGHRLQEEIKVMLYKAEIEARRRIIMIDLPKLVKNEYEFYKGDPRLKHMIDVKMNIQDGIPSFKSFPGDFSQSISNLFTNAVEAMETCSEKNLIIDLTYDDEFITFKMADTGPGMDQETLNHAFDPFFTTKTPEAGGKYPPRLATGIGLTHVRNLLEPAGVLIDLNSELGKGTTIELKIPYKELDQKAEEYLKGMS